MNAMFELEVNSFRKTVKDLVCLTSVDKLFHHREPTQSVCVADWYFIVNVLDFE